MGTVLIVSVALIGVALIVLTAKKKLEHIIPGVSVIAAGMVTALVVYYNITEFRSFDKLLRTGVFSALALLVFYLVIMGAIRLFSQAKERRANEAESEPAALRSFAGEMALAEGVQGPKARIKPYAGEGDAEANAKAKQAPKAEAKQKLASTLKLVKNESGPEKIKGVRVKAVDLPKSAPSFKPVELEKTAEAGRAGEDRVFAKQVDYALNAAKLSDTDRPASIQARLENAAADKAPLVSANAFAGERSNVIKPVFPARDDGETKPPPVEAVLSVGAPVKTELRAEARKRREALAAASAAASKQKAGEAVESHDKGDLKPAGALKGQGLAPQPKAPEEAAEKVAAIKSDNITVLSQKANSGPLKGESKAGLSVAKGAAPTDKGEGKAGGDDGKAERRLFQKEGARAASQQPALKEEPVKSAGNTALMLEKAAELEKNGFYMLAAELYKKCALERGEDKQPALLALDCLARAKSYGEARLMAARLLSGSYELNEFERGKVRALNAMFSAMPGGAK